jgi:hypothetical protein
LKKKKTTDLENYEKEYLSRLKHEKKTEPVKKKKPSVKKTKKKVSKKPRKGAKVKPSKYDDDDTGIVLIDDDLKHDEQMELEERKAYLEEARSQESSD